MKTFVAERRADAMFAAGFGAMAFIRTQDPRMALGATALGFGMARGAEHFDKRSMRKARQANERMAKERGRAVTTAVTP